MAPDQVQFFVLFPKLLHFQRKKNKPATRKDEKYSTNSLELFRVHMKCILWREWKNVALCYAVSGEFWDDFVTPSPCSTTPAALAAS